MESKQFYAVWLCIFALAGCYLRLSDAAPPCGPDQMCGSVGEMGLESSKDVVPHDGGQQAMSKSRIVRWVPNENSNVGPSPAYIEQERIRARIERERRLREERQRERTAAVQRKISSALAKERQDYERGNAELWERYSQAQSNKQTQTSPRRS